MNDQLIAEALIGDEAGRFLESDLGRTVLGFLDQEKEIAKEGLASVDPEDAKKIRELQYQIWRAEQFRQWLCELRDNGNAALEAYQQQKGGHEP